MQNSLFHSDDENRVEIVDLDTLAEDGDTENSLDTPLVARKVPRKRLHQRRVVLALRIGLATLTLAGFLTLGVLIWPTVVPKFSGLNKTTLTATTPIFIPRLNANISSQVYASNGTAYIFSIHDGAQATQNNPHDLSNTSLEAVSQYDGRVLWNFREWNNYAGQQPDQIFLAAGTLYISSFDNLEALRASDGAVLWQTHSVGHVVIVNNTIMSTDTSNGAGILALRASDGQVLWQDNTVTYALMNNPQIATSQALYAYDNMNHDLLSLDLVNGSILWRYHIPAGSSMLTSTNNKINSFSNPSGSLSAPAANPNTLRWHYTDILKIWTTYDARLYALLPDGHTVALDPLTGSILWDQSSIGDILQADAGVLYSTPLSTNGVDARSTSNGSLMWHDNVATFPIIAQDGTLYVSTPMALAAFNATDGQQRWQVPAVKVQILQIADDNLYLQFIDDGSVEVLKAQNGQKLWTYNNYDATDNSLSEQNGITYISSLSNGSVVARRSSDGKVLWTHTAELLNSKTLHLSKTP